MSPRPLSDLIRSVRQRHPGLTDHQVAERLGCRLSRVQHVRYDDERRADAVLGDLARRAGLTEADLQRLAELRRQHIMDERLRPPRPPEPFISLGAAVATVALRLVKPTGRLS